MNTEYAFAIYSIVLTIPIFIFFNIKLKNYIQNKINNSVSEINMLNLKLYTIYEENSEDENEENNEDENEENSDEDLNSDDLENIEEISDVDDKAILENDSERLGISEQLNKVDEFKLNYNFELNNNESSLCDKEIMEYINNDYKVDLYEKIVNNLDYYYE